jgi:hypothetical protein
MTKPEEQRTEERLQQIEAERKHGEMRFQELESIVNKWLIIEDKYILKVLCAVVIANRMENDPLWLMIVAPSGGTKTELISGLSEIEGVFPISDLTPNTLLSGFTKKENASLLLNSKFPKENAILTFKDFTTVLEMNSDKRREILAQLREVYDGSIRKPFGTGEIVEWKGKLGVIVGVTPIIDIYSSVTQVLGERFIYYRPIMPDGITMAIRAMSGSGKEITMREELKVCFARYIHGTTIPKVVPEIPREIGQKIANLACFAVLARSGVVRDGYSRDIRLIPAPEQPTRLAKQFGTLYKALEIIESNPSENYRIVHRVAIDTIPSSRKEIFLKLYKSSEWVEGKEIIQSSNQSESVIRRHLEEIEGLRLTQKRSGEGINSYQWALSPKCETFMKAMDPDSKEQLDLLSADTMDSFVEHIEKEFGKGPNKA